MVNGLLSKERINTARQKEIDLLKAYSIIMMIITHCIDELLNYEGFSVAEVIDDNLAQILGAEGFMICMGLGIIYSRKAAAGDYLGRGFSLLVTGQILNLIRYFIPSYLTYAVAADEGARAYGFLVFSSDILQFAGLFFIAMALFTHLRLKSWHIFVISVVLNIIGTLTFGTMTVGNYPIDQFIGLFAYNETECYFPFIHWMIFPAFGLVFGELLMHVNDKKKFYGILFIPSVLVFAAYYLIDAYFDDPVFSLFSDWRSFCYIRIWDAACAIMSNLALLCICWFAVRFISERGMKAVGFVSKNINRYYCVHYVFVIPLSMYLFYISGEYLNNDIAVYAIAAAVILATTLIVFIYDRHLAGKFHTFFGKHPYLWSAAVILVSILAAVWAYKADVSTEEFPNLHNDYGVGDYSLL